MMLGCQCGTKLAVRPEQYGKLVKCPKCSALVTAPREEADGLRILEVEPAPAAAIRRPRFEAPARVHAAPAVPWEIWTLLAILVLNMIGNVLTLAGGQGGAFSFIGIVTGIIIAKGLWDRAAWAWWWCMLGSVVSALLSFWVLSEPKIIPAHALPDPTLVLIGLAGCIVSVVALLTCRFRGAYAADA